MLMTPRKPSLEGVIFPSHILDLYTEWSLNSSDEVFDTLSERDTKSYAIKLT